MRVYRKVEDWLEVAADNAFDAETIAEGRPGVLSVFRRSAIPADRPLGTNPNIRQGVEDDDD